MKCRHVTNLPNIYLTHIWFHVHVVQSTLHIRSAVREFIFANVSIDFLLLFFAVIINHSLGCTFKNWNENAIWFGGWNIIKIDAGAGMMWYVRFSTFYRRKHTHIRALTHRQQWIVFHVTIYRVIKWYISQINCYHRWNLFSFITFFMVPMPPVPISLCQQQQQQQRQHHHHQQQQQQKHTTFFWSLILSLSFSRSLSLTSRFCLIVFTLFTVLATFAVLASAPHIIVS